MTEDDQTKYLLIGACWFGLTSAAVHQWQKEKYLKFGTVTSLILNVQIHFTIWKDVEPEFSLAVPSCEYYSGYCWMDIRFFFFPPCFLVTENNHHYQACPDIGQFALNSFGPNDQVAVSSLYMQDRNLQIDTWVAFSTDLYTHTHTRPWVVLSSSSSCWVQDKMLLRIKSLTCKKMGFELLNSLKNL